MMRFMEYIWVQYLVPGDGGFAALLNTSKELAAFWETCLFFDFFLFLVRLSIYIYDT